MSQLFSPITLAGTQLANRIVVSPMCQYSAVDGSATLWHHQHFGQYALSGAGLFIIEATGVEAQGRITPGCLGLYSDENEKALAAALKVARAAGKARIGIQFGHAGRKASCHAPWDGGGALKADEGAWQTLAPSAIGYDDQRPAPKALDAADMARIVEAFAAAARRAARLDLDLLELHAAHGYLLHQFLSPLSNRREDDYGGSRENRMRFPLAVARALREAWPKDRILGARINVSDFTEGGATVDDGIAFAAALKAIGYDYVCASAGSLFAGQSFTVSPGYLLGPAARVKAEAGIATMGVGLIATPEQAEAAIAEGLVDMVAMARAFLDDPRWVWHAAEKLGIGLELPKQYNYVQQGRWPGAKLVRP